MRRAIGFGVTLLVGAVAGFFTAGPLVFADGSMGGRIATMGLVALIYLLLGAIAGRWLRSWTAGLLLAAPGMAVALVMGDKGFIVALTMSVLLIAAVASARVGARWGTRR